MLHTDYKGSIPLVATIRVNPYIDTGANIMYHRDIETDIEAHHQHVLNQMKNASDRLKAVKAKMKLKKKDKR